MPLCPGRPQRTEQQSHPWGMNNPGTREWIALGLSGFSKICEQIFLSFSYMVCPLWMKPTSPHQAFTANPSLCSVAQPCQTLSPMDCSTPGFTALRHLLEPAQTMSTESVMPSNHLILCRPLLLLPSIFPSIRVFSDESVLHIMWPKYWSFSISPSNEYSGQIFFRTDQFLLLAVQRTLKGLLQHHSSKASILWCQGFFMVLFSHPYMTTGKTIVSDI